MNSLHTRLAGATGACVLLLIVTPSPLRAQVTWTGPNGYVYNTPPNSPGYIPYQTGGRFSGYFPTARGYGSPAMNPYGGYGYYGGPYYRSPYTDLPPYGFGVRGLPYGYGFSPYYGPGVNEFLYFGGADFHGW